ncbi:MAG TPA: glycosyltransferase family 2 protein [Bryobacteraceae bacterium]|nr:glycosyltransferase family 2 protein [Bryobacteraceae bacterium]
MRDFAEIVLWTAVASVFYLYVGYPALLAALRAAFGRPVLKQRIEPSVSLLIPAYNEARVIARKVRNSLELDYPPEKLEIVVASDGSRDATTRLAEEAALGCERVRVLLFEENRGKLAVLNDVVPGLAGEIVVFTDAATMVVPGAVRALVAHFADPQVGAVSGLYRVTEPEQAEVGKQEDLYWRYETWLKTQEAGLWSALGAHGALYGIRKELYPSLEPGVINDDYVIPVRILQRGYRVSYEPEAVAVEEAVEMDGFARRIRIMAGNFHQLREITAFLKPFRPAPLFVFLSHKAGRLLAPFAMMAALAANLVLLGEPLYRATAVLQVLFYGFAVVGAVARFRSGALRAPFYFCMLNAAVLAGLWYAVAGRAKPVWKAANAGP